MKQVNDLKSLTFGLFGRFRGNRVKRNARCTENDKRTVYIYILTRVEESITCPSFGNLIFEFWKIIGTRRQIQRPQIRL